MFAVFIFTDTWIKSYQKWRRISVYFSFYNKHPYYMSHWKKRNTVILLMLFARTWPHMKVQPRVMLSLSLQVVGTGMLVLCILAIIDGGNIGAPKGVEPLAIGLIIMAIGVSMGLNCGYPLNPARDLGPRLFTAVAGWGMDVFRWPRDTFGI